MLNLTKREYLESVLKPLKTKGFKSVIKNKRSFNNSFLDLTIRYRINYLQLSITQNWTRIFGHYKIRILTSDVKLLEKVDLANQKAKILTPFLNFEKRKFHKRLNFAIKSLEKNQNDIFEKIGGSEAYADKIASLKTNKLYQEKLSIYNYISPAIGIESDNSGIHLCFGIAVGGDRSGGLLLFDPFEGQLEVGGYLGFGNYGIATVHEFDILDTISDSIDIDLSWD